MTTALEQAQERAKVRVAGIPTEWVSMTQATECIWGTSGRGNPNAVRLIETAAQLGVLEIKQVGKRNRMVRMKAS